LSINVVEAGSATIYFLECINAKFIHIYSESFETKFLEISAGLCFSVFFSVLVIVNPFYFATGLFITFVWRYYLYLRASLRCFIYGAFLLFNGDRVACD